jgi:hypothetical protein
MYCPDCGKPSADAFARFCGSCGTDMKSLGGEAPVSTPAPAPARRPVATTAPRGRVSAPAITRGRGEDLGGGEVDIQEFDASSIELTEDDFICEATNTRTQKMFFQGR